MAGTHAQPHRTGQGARIRQAVLWRGDVVAIVLLVALLLTQLAGCANSAATPDPELVGGSGALEIKGSDTLVNLTLAWAERYMADNPGVRVSVTGGGTGTGIAAVLNGTADIATASRALEAEEVAAAEEAGFIPVEHTVALDAIAIVINPNNPVDQLSLQQISDIYTGRITNWSEVGGEDRPIVLLSRESNSGTYAYFLENVIRHGGQSDRLFAPDTLLMPSSEGISEEVRHNPNAIGYDGLGYVTPDQKVVAVAVDPAGPFVLPSIDTVNDGSYPIARPLFMVTPGEPTGVVAEFLSWVTGAGQELVPDIGFVPLQ